MHKNNFVMAVKVDGKVLREFDGKVYLPFGSEYKILLKNLSSIRASVKVSIDGVDVLGGNSLIIDGNRSMDLARFLDNGDMERGNAFKFIEKTQKISDHRGDKAEDGLLTITYEFEQPQAAIVGRAQYRGILPDTDFASRRISGGLPHTSWHSSTMLADSTPVALNAVQTQAASNTSGITAPGAITEQSFGTVYGFKGTGVYHTMTMELKGGAVSGPVTTPVAVKKREKCPMCGTIVRQTAKFCHECGSSVEFV